MIVLNSSALSSCTKRTYKVHQHEKSAEDQIPDTDLIESLLPQARLLSETDLDGGDIGGLNRGCRKVCALRQDGDGCIQARIIYRAH